MSLFGHEGANGGSDVLGRQLERCEAVGLEVFERTRGDTGDGKGFVGREIVALPYPIAGDADQIADR